MANNSTKINEFFASRFFVVPKYQRGYAWELQNIRDLFDDIQESIDSASNHYLGTIVLSKSGSDDELFYIVDGQQRLTTIILIISALTKFLSVKDKEFYERCFIKENDRYRLVPQNRDEVFFCQLLDGKVGIPENKSQRALKMAIEEINARLTDIHDKLHFLKSMLKLEVMQFVENTEGDAIRIFQTVNDRGKPLSIMEKVKSLLIYFSNRYLDKALDNEINNHFSDIFETYNDIKQTGENLGINLISNRVFTEDSLMRYHFVTYSLVNYEPSAEFVLQHLKNQLNEYRSKAADNDYNNIRDFIATYINSLKDFFDHCKVIIERAKTDPRYYKLFVILDLSATLYPAVIRLNMRGLLDEPLHAANEHSQTFLDLIELIEVRVYKTRGTDPKAHIAEFVYKMTGMSEAEIEGWLKWYNQYWMPKESFRSNLYESIYGNKALNHMLITYSESLRGSFYDVEGLQKLVDKHLSIEHILSQTPNFSPVAFGFKDMEEFQAHEHRLGNLSILERNMNTAAKNKDVLDKVQYYDRSEHIISKRIGTQINTWKKFAKAELDSRTEELATYCLNRWWC